MLDNDEHGAHFLHHRRLSVPSSSASSASSVPSSSASSMSARLMREISLIAFGKQQQTSLSGLFNCLQSPRRHLKCDTKHDSQPRGRRAHLLVKIFHSCRYQSYHFVETTAPSTEREQKHRPGQWSCLMAPHLEVHRPPLSSSSSCSHRRRPRRRSVTSIQTTGVSSN